MGTFFRQTIGRVESMNNFRCINLLKVNGRSGQATFIRKVLIIICFKFNELERDLFVILPTLIENHERSEYSYVGLGDFFGFSSKSLLSGSNLLFGSLLKGRHTSLSNSKSEKATKT